MVTFNSVESQLMTKMPYLKNKNILLGVTGGIAAYKSTLLIRELVRLGAQVKVVMTSSAQEFISPLTLQALSGEIVRSETFDSEAERAMSHIELARWADYLVISPCSANFMAKMAHGIADCLLSTLYLVAENIPVILCPAMNRSMWQHPATQANRQTLLNRDVMLVGPDIGEQACGEFGPGRLVETHEIINAIQLHTAKNLLQNHKILITAGPTHEEIDPVRYLTNHSSGKMGYALATAAQFAGAKVTLISGPSNLPKPFGVDFISVKSAKDMLSQVQKHVSSDTIFISCAAVADYHIANPASQKIKKGPSETLELKLVKNPDILKDIATSKIAKYTVGFAAETNNLNENAQQKLNNKQVDMIIANQVGENFGFNSDDNSVKIFTKDKVLNIEKQHKITLAGKIIEFLAENINMHACTPDKISEY